jgi:UDP-N-acetylmuramate--alanine ligase
MTEFSRAFEDADTVQVLDIYAASEEPIAGVTGEALADAIDAAGPQIVDYARSVPEAVGALVREAKAGDVVLTLGAGSVSQAGPVLLEALGANG